MADIITLLPDHVANQIAAGEVVQRPASVVKELLENAIDAKAENIQLIIQESGKKLIQVIDDGKGMSETDARLAFERHATSKIKQIDDLFSLQTKGFRGEALASIAAVAQIEMHTKQEKDEVGTHLKIAASKVEYQNISATTKGTSIAIRNLFFNIPARRNFLKSNNVELRHIIDEFHRVALAYPSISFVFQQNNSTLLNLSKGTLSQRIVAIFGKKIEEKLVTISSDTTVGKISGYIIKPDYARKNRGQQFFFVNNRFIKSPFLHHSIVQSFKGLLPEGYYPGYFIFFELNPESIDINIHPTKTEIKFENEQDLYAILKSATRHSLGMFQITPSLDFNHNPSLDIPYSYKSKSPKDPAIEVDKSFNPFVQKSEKITKEQWEPLVKIKESSLNTIPQNNSFLTEDITIRNHFQINNKYIVTHLDEDVLVINQYRAHQRILYEDFLQSVTTKKQKSQQLLFPINIELSLKIKSIFAEIKETFLEMGFSFEVLSDNELKVNGVPAICMNKNIKEVIENLFETFETESPVESFSYADSIAQSLCKSLAITNGMPLNHEEQKSIIEKLLKCKDSLTTPFNKKIYFLLSKNEMDKQLN